MPSSRSGPAALGVALCLALALAPVPLAAEPADGASVEPPTGREFAARRAALGERLGSDAVALVMAAEDQDEFRQKPSFAWLTGVAEADAILLLEPGNAERTETLYLKPRDRAQERWTGTTLDPGEVDANSGEPDAARRATEAATGVAAVRPLSALDGDLSRALGRGRTLFIDAAAAPAGKPPGAELFLVQALRLRRANLEVKELAPALRELRMIKSESELDAIRRATELTLAAHRELAADLRPGRHEYETKAVLEYVMKRGGASGLAFPSVVGSGPNSTVLHYRDDRRRMVAGDLVVVDIGAAFAGYAADVTRTYPVSGRFTLEQREVYDAVLAAQDAAIARVKPGAKLRSDVHQAAVDVIEKRGFKGRFPHSTSHHVGLEVHDPGERDGVLRPGMVITVEPGIYLGERGIGVRIEDMVLVTAKGHELLSSGLPRRAEEIEALMAPVPDDAANSLRPASSQQ